MLSADVYNIFIYLIVLIVTHCLKIKIKMLVIAYRVEGIHRRTRRRTFRA